MYIVLNIFYTLKFKKIPILDIFIIASGFVLRLFIGAAPLMLTLSHWIVILTFLLALFLALAKRRDDVILQEEHNIVSRDTTSGYNKAFLDTAMAISASVVIIAYIFYSIDDAIVQRLHNNYLYLTSVFVLLGIFRYMQICFVYNESGDPSRVLLKDRFLQFVIFSWVVSFGVIIYI